MGMPTRKRSASPPDSTGSPSARSRPWRRTTRSRTCSLRSPLVTSGERRRRPQPDPSPARAMRRILVQARKELTQIVRDRLALALALVLPVGLTALLGTSISLTVTDIPIVVQDLDQTPLSRQYADVFRNSLTFRVVTLPPARSPETMLRLGRVRAAVIVPE